MAAPPRPPALPSPHPDAAALRTYVIALKDVGNERFAGGKDEEACEVYSRALDGCGASMDDLRGTVLCNRAACHLKRERWEACIAVCSEALHTVPCLFFCF